MKTAAGMQVPITFLSARWDFADKRENDTKGIQAVCEGTNCPRLVCQFIIGDFDADADTDFADFCILAEHWLAADGSFWCGQGCDLTSDGNIDSEDLIVFAQNWLAHTAP